MASELEGFNFEQRHGKERVRVARVWRTHEGRHFMVEWCVGINLFSDCLDAYARDDNSNIVATDTMKNTVYVKAKECSEQLSVEDFAILLAKHFTSFYKQVTAAIVKIVEKPWDRIYVDGQPHEHGFKLGSEKHTTEVIVKKSGALKLTSGVQGLSVLKTTMSGFEGFIRDEYTVLPETRERILATEVTASWRYSYDTVSSVPSDPLYFKKRYMDAKSVLMSTFFGPPKEGVYSASVQSTLYQMARAVLARFPDISAVQLKMPNLHFLPVNISSKENPSIVKVWKLIKVLRDAYFLFKWNTDNAMARVLPYHVQSKELKRPILCDVICVCLILVVVMPLEILGTGSGMLDQGFSPIESGH